MDNIAFFHDCSHPSTSTLFIKICIKSTNPEEVLNQINDIKITIKKETSNMFITRANHYVDMIHLLPVFNNQSSGHFITTSLMIYSILLDTLVRKKTIPLKNKYI